MCEFKIQELALLNYRRFENEKFTLNPRMNVFAGKNGSGKTTVLEAANVMLGAYLAAYKTYVPSRFVYNIKSADVRQKAQISEDSTIFTTGTISQYPCKISCIAKWGEQDKTIEACNPERRCQNKIWRFKSDAADSNSVGRSNIKSRSFRY